jgi:hypothetical protein
MKVGGGGIRTKILSQTGHGLSLKRIILCILWTLVILVGRLAKNISYDNNVAYMLLITMKTGRTGLPLRLFALVLFK